MIENGRLVNQQTGAPMTFEILLVNPEFERITLPFVQNLKRLGIQATVRVIDTAQYQNRTDSFDFDMTSGSGGRADRRATSSATTGARRPPRRRAAATSPASRTRPSTC